MVGGMGERKWREFHSPDAAAAVATACSSALLQRFPVLCGLYGEAQVLEDVSQRCVCERACVYVQLLKRHGLLDKRLWWLDVAFVSSGSYCYRGARTILTAEAKLHNTTIYF